MPSSHPPSCKSHKTTASVSFVGQMLQQSFYCLDSESSIKWVGIISEGALTKAEFAEEGIIFMNRFPSPRTFVN